MKKRTVFTDMQTSEDKVYDMQDFKKFSCACVAFITLMLGLYFAYVQVRWDKHVREWDKVEGTIIQNKKVRVRSFFSDDEHTESYIEYEYKYNGKKYYGTKIVYGRDYYPDGKAGDRRQVIVNPESPRDCAIMSRDYGVNGFFPRYFKSMFWFGLFIFCLVYLSQLSRGNEKVSCSAGH